MLPGRAWSLGLACLLAAAAAWGAPALPPACTGRDFDLDALLKTPACEGAAAALRWKCQINESAKTPAFWNVHPELCHNEVAGWGLNGDATRQLVTLVNLRHDAEHPQVSRRFDLVTDALREVMAELYAEQA